jgi:hypothetical protein
VVVVVAVAAVLQQKESNMDSRAWLREDGRVRFHYSQRAPHPGRELASQWTPSVARIALANWHSCLAAISQYVFAASTLRPFLYACDHSREAIYSAYPRLTTNYMFCSSDARCSSSMVYSSPWSVEAVFSGVRVVSGIICVIDSK